MTDDWGGSGALVLLAALVMVGFAVVGALILFGVWIRERLLLLRRHR